MEIKTTLAPIIIDERDWIPSVMFQPGRKVSIKIGFGEAELREQVKKPMAFGIRI